MGLQFEVGSPEAVTLAGGEVGKRHFVSAAHFGLEVMHLTGAIIARVVSITIGYCSIHIEPRRGNPANGKTLVRLLSNADAGGMLDRKSVV